MILNGWWQVFLAGLMGPVMVEFIKIYRLRGQRIKSKYRKAQYWLLTVPILPISGFIACAHGTQNVRLTLALQLGATAPLLIGTYASGKPKSQSYGIMPKPEKAMFLDLLSWSDSD